MTKVYEFLSLLDKRNIYAVGDIHGCFSKLEERLTQIGFDKNQDFLISLGDLVDRGPESHLAKDYAKEPWFKHIIGNHEEMTRGHIQGDSYIHTINGGGWLADIEYPDKSLHVDVLMDSCYLLEVLTPKGVRAGFVHADLRWSNWQENINAPDLKTFTWSREGIRNLRNPDYNPTISGIDKVFFGHNAVYKAFNRGNCYWIDTGSGFSDGFITVVNVDTDKVYSG
jgi:serine/threonine protein phosphatase 1